MPMPRVIFTLYTDDARHFTIILTLGTKPDDKREEGKKKDRDT